MDPKKGMLYAAGYTKTKYGRNLETKELLQRKCSVTFLFLLGLTRAFLHNISMPHKAAKTARAAASLAVEKR